MEKEVYKEQSKFVKQKSNEKILLGNGFIHCAHCKKFIFKTDKYCQYCGKPMGIKIS